MWSYGDTWPRSLPSSARGPETDWHRTRASVVRGEHSTKELFKHMIIIIRYIYIWARDMASSSACVTWTYMTCTIGCSTCKSFIPEYWHQALANPCVQCQANRTHGGHHYGETWPRPFPSSTRRPENDMSWLEIEPRPLRWEASTLAKRYSKRL